MKRRQFTTQTEIILADVHREIKKAVTKFSPMHSAHEGYAVIKEELDELWEEVRAKERQPDEMRAEAIQVAAMAVRFVLDISDYGEYEPYPVPISKNRTGQGDGS